MKLNREQFLAAAMMLSAVPLGGCRSRSEQGTLDSINAEGSPTNIGQNGATINGAPGNNQGAAALGARGAGFARTPTGEGVAVRGPTGEGFAVRGPAAEGGLAPIPFRGPTAEVGVGARGIAPTREVGVRPGLAPIGATPVKPH